MVSLEKGRNVPLVGQASRPCSGHARCLRDGAYAPSLAILVPKGLSSTVYHLCITMMILALDYAMRK
jgi:hypothetical protein